MQTSSTLNASKGQHVDHRTSVVTAALPDGAPMLPGVIHTLLFEMVSDSWQIVSIIFLSLNRNSNWILTDIFGNYVSNIISLDFSCWPWFRDDRKIFLIQFLTISSLSILVWLCSMCARGLINSNESKAESVALDIVESNVYKYKSKTNDNLNNIIIKSNEHKQNGTAIACFETVVVIITFIYLPLARDLVQTIFFGVVFSDHDVIFYVAISVAPVIFLIGMPLYFYILIRDFRPKLPNNGKDIDPNTKTNTELINARYERALENQNKNVYYCKSLYDGYKMDWVSILY